MARAALIGVLVLAVAGCAADTGGTGQLRLGRETYARECSRCHMLDGSGVRGVYPSLAGDPIVRLPRAELTLDVVLSGRRAMPGFGGQLPVQQLAAVVTYIRRSWGNRASAVSAADVK